MAFRRQKHHFQVPAVPFDAVVLRVSSGIRWCESIIFLFWDSILQGESPASVCLGAVHAKTIPATLHNSYS